MNKLIKKTEAERNFLLLFTVYNLPLKLSANNYDVSIIELNFHVIEAIKLQNNYIVPDIIK